MGLSLDVGLNSMFVMLQTMLKKESAAADSCVTTRQRIVRRKKGEMAELLGQTEKISLQISQF